MALFPPIVAKNGPTVLTVKPRATANPPLLPNRRSNFFSLFPLPSPFLILFLDPVILTKKNPIHFPNTATTMPTWSSLRRSQPFRHRNLPILQPLQTRQFCVLSPPPQLPPPPPHSRLNNAGSTNSSQFLRWVSGIITGSTVALALYSYSSSVKFPSLSYADGLLPPDEAGITSVSLAGDHAVHPQQQDKPRFLFGDAYRRKVFFNYEKRIRMRSPPEKVFEYFSSFNAEDGETFMTPADLMRAVVPVFPPSESHFVREGYLRGERSPGELRCAPSEFFMLFDTNNDGLVSFKEYIFFVTLLSIPESSFSVAFKMFDLDCNGEIDMDEFKKVMALMRTQNRQGSLHCDGRRPGRSVGGSVENGGLVEYFFGEDGKKRLHHDKFVQFLRDLHNEILRLEFAHYDYRNRGTISAKDFALSMVASADLKHLNKLLDRVDDTDNTPHLSNIRITEEEFKNFAELRRKLQPFSLALFSFGEVNGLLTRMDFKRAASQVCGISLTDNVIEIIFHVFDANGDGSLTASEFVRVLQKRERDIAHPREAGIFSFLSCCLTCNNNSYSAFNLLS